MRIATALGAQAIWLPDHFMGFAPKWMWRADVIPAARLIHSMDALFDPVPILTVAALQHRRAWIGTSVTEPIRRHPMSLAQTFATLDHIARGRVILGIGNGLRENTEPYGLSADKRIARLDEALDIIAKLWSSRGTPVSHDGRFWTLKDAVFDLPLYSDRPPRIFVGAHFPRMLRLCGRHADGWLPGEKVTGEVYASRLAVIRESAERAGRSLRDFLPCQTLLVAFGSSREAVLEKALRHPYVAYNALGLPSAVWKEHGLAHPFGDEFQGFVELVPSRVTPGDIEAVLARATPALIEHLFYMGTPEQILEEAAPLAAAGCRHFIVANMGAAFTGAGAGDLWRLGRLMRALKRL